MIPDRVAFVHFGAQQWKPAEIEVSRETLTLEPSGEKVECVAVSFIPKTGNHNHWLTLSPEQAKELGELLRNA